jgi:hypothetical protein
MPETPVVGRCGQGYLEFKDSLGNMARHYLKKTKRRNRIEKINCVISLIETKRHEIKFNV